MWSIDRPARAFLFFLSIFGLSLAAPGRSAAQNKQDGCLQDTVCRDRYHHALKFYDEGNYTEALSEFDAAYKRRRMPWLLLNIGRTLQRLGRPHEALAHYEQYKKAELNMDAETLERVNKYIEQAQALLAQPGAAPGDAAPAANATNSDHPAAGKDPKSTASGNPAATPPKPIYKKWWFWTIIGVVVAGGVAGAVGGSLAAKKSTDPIAPGAPVYMPTF